MKKSILLGYFLLAACSGATAPSQYSNAVVSEGIVSAPNDEVWRVFSTAEGFKALGVAQAKMDFRVGGLILSSYDAKAVLGDQNTIQTEIIAYDPKRLLVTRIHQPPKGFPFMEAYKQVWTVISMTDLGEGRTHLRISMNGYTADDESQKMRGFFEQGNDWVLKTLQARYAVSKAPTGPAHAESPLSAIDIVQLVPAAREDVWKSMSTQEGWKSFFGADSRIGRFPGDAFEPFDGAAGSRLLAMVNEEMLSFTWPAPSEFPYAKTHPTWVVVTFESPSAGMTRVRLRHLGFAEQSATHPDHASDFEKVREKFSGQWANVLKRLAAHFDATAK